MPISKKPVSSCMDVKMLLHALLWLGSCYGLFALNVGDDNAVITVLAWFTMVHLLIALLTETPVTGDELIVLVGWFTIMHFILFKVWVALDDGVSCEVRRAPGPLRRFEL